MIIRIQIVLWLVVAAKSDYLTQYFNQITSTTKAPARSEPCDHNGKRGQCIHWKKCFTILVDRQNGDYPGICYYDGADPIVCCTSCDIVDDITKGVVNPNGGVLWQTNQKSWNQCVKYFLDLPYECKYEWETKKSYSYENNCTCIVTREGHLIANGWDAKRSEYPHMALLGYGPENATQWLCAGSVISDRFILTAGHCIASSKKEPVTWAALGLLKRSDPEDIWERYRIEKIIPHEEYRPPSKYHDIALLKTDRTIQFGVSVLPICLPKLSNDDINEVSSTTYYEYCGIEPHNQPSSEESAFAIGWGATGYRADVADNLQAVKLEKFNSSQCSKSYGVHRNMRRGYDYMTQMCYGNSEEIKDTCEGDSGGPLQTYSQTSRCQYAIIGVTSFGRACGIEAQAGIYTRVRHYVPWIESVVWPDSENESVE